MTPQDAIEKILNSKSVTDVFDDIYDFKQGYKNLIQLIHPDRCSLPKAEDASNKLNLFKDELEKGKKHKDDSGEACYALKTVTITGDKDLIKKSYNNYNYLMSLKDEASVNFQKYIPNTATLVSDTEIKFELWLRAVPLSSLGVLSQDHTNWILSRMFEFAAWMHQIGYSHCGINPESIYVMPENHQMCCISFYHMTKLNTPLTTVSAKYKDFYPPQVFVNKKSESNIDVELAKRTAIYLLGDKSGSGVMLRKTHNNEIIDFLQKQSYEAGKNFFEYRELLNKHFPKKFHVLNV